MVQTPGPKWILASAAKRFGMNPSQKHIGNLWNSTNISSVCWENLRAPDDVSVKKVKTWPWTEQGTN